MQKVKTLCYKQVEGIRIMADVYSINGKALPAVIFIHGGALIWGSRQDVQPAIVELLNLHGYAVISIDYRLAPTTKLPEILKDVEDAISWVKGGCGGIVAIDPGKIAVIGSSAGGYLALSSGIFTSKPSAIVSFYGYGSIAEEWYLKPSLHYQGQGIVEETDALTCLGSSGIISEASFDRFPYYVYTRQKGTWPQTVTGREVCALGEFCPEKKVNADYPETLLIHGTKDSDVPFECSISMALALGKAGKSVDLHLVAGREHVFDQNTNDPEVSKVYKRVISFLSLHFSDLESAQQPPAANRPRRG